MATDSPRLLTLGCNHHRTPLEIRERLALTREGVDQLQQSLKEHPGLSEAAVLNTCNRMEIYAVSQNGSGRQDLADLLARIKEFPVEEFLAHAYSLENLEAVKHAYRVASGLDSQMVGETQILGQMKASYAEAVENQLAGPVLHRFFQKAFQAAKWARSETRIGNGQVSLGNVAVELATRIFGRLTVSRTLVVGSGEIGREVAKAFRSRGVACMSIASRTPERAENLARSVDGLIIPYATWKDHLPYTDIAIFATSSPNHLCTAEEIALALGKRPRRPLFLIDLAVPRDVDAAAANLENLYLYNLEDLSAIANENLRSREKEIQACLAELEKKALLLWERLGRHR